MKSYLAIGTGPAIAPAERFAKEESRTVLAFLSLLLLALILAMPNAHAEDRTKQDVSRGGEHPAVIVARRGVQVDPTSNFYLHPARLSWSLQRPTGSSRPDLEVLPAPGLAELESATTDGRARGASRPGGGWWARFGEESGPIRGIGLKAGNGIARNAIAATEAFFEAHRSQKGDFS